jgi:hypothetical protein
MQRHLFAAVILTASVASAAPVPGLDPLPSVIPAHCAALAKVPDSATIPGPTLAAHVSVANCMAEVGMNAVAQTGDDASIAKLDEAVATSIDILDSVIRAGDPYWKVVAEAAKLDTYDSMIVRERVSIPASDFAAHAALEPKLVRWQEDAKETLAAITAQTRTPQMATRR